MLSAGEESVVVNSTLDLDGLGWVRSITSGEGGRGGMACIDGSRREYFSNVVIGVEFCRRGVILENKGELLLPKGFRKIFRPLDCSAVEGSFGSEGVI